ACRRPELGAASEARHGGAVRALSRGECGQAEKLPAGCFRRSLRRPALRYLPPAAQPGHRQSRRQRRQEMSISRRHMLLLLPAAAVAWKHVLAGTPESSPNYTMSQHWWGMLIDLTKCIGCGNCVRGCQAENDVPDGYFRTWVERYHVTDYDIENPHVDSPDGGIKGFPPTKEAGGKNFFVPKLCNECADSPCTQVCPVGATFISPDGVVLIDKKYCLG